MEERRSREERMQEERAQELRRRTGGRVEEEIERTRREEAGGEKEQTVEKEMGRRCSVDTEKGYQRREEEIRRGRDMEEDVFLAHGTITKRRERMTRVRKEKGFSNHARASMAKEVQEREEKQRRDQRGRHESRSQEGAQNCSPRIQTSSFDDSDFMNDVLGGEFDSTMGNGPAGQEAELDGVPDNEWDKEGGEGMNDDEEEYDENVDSEEEISMDDEPDSSRSSRTERNEDDDFDIQAYVAVTLEYSDSDGAADVAAAEAGRVFPVDLSTLSEDEQKKRRAEQKRASKKRSQRKAKAEIEADRVAEMTWVPRRCVPYTPEVEIKLSGRWRCEQLIRAYTANLGAREGVNVVKNFEVVRMDCRRKDCAATITFNRQPKSGLWKLNRFQEHENQCYGQSNDTKYCQNRPAYTAEQVARALRDEFALNPDMPTSVLASILRAKSIYRRQPANAHIRAVMRELNRYISAARAVDMAALEGYSGLLRELGHRVDVFILSGTEMKAQRIKAARFIYKQQEKLSYSEKQGSIHAGFNVQDVDVSDIPDYGKYYGGFLFVPMVAEAFCRRGRMTCAADAAHCEGLGRRSYGTTFEVFGYDTNHHLCPLVFAHFVGAEGMDTWAKVFAAAADIPGFDVPTRTTIVDQEKSIDSAYKRCMRHAKLFLDPLHVRKNLGTALGAGKVVGVRMYDKALRNPSRDDVIESKNYFPKKIA